MSGDGVVRWRIVEGRDREGAIFGPIGRTSTVAVYVWTGWGGCVLALQPDESQSKVRFAR